MKKKKNGRSKTESERKRVNVWVHADIFAQIMQLSEALRITQTAVISQAVARWFHAEPILHGGRHGDSHAGVHGSARG